MTDTTIRLDKFLSGAGIISRRGVKQFLKANTVTVDGRRVTESGTRIANTDSVQINGEKIKKPDFVYFLLNKPMGVISTTADEFGRDTVTSLIDTNERIYPVGRLDKDTHGLVLLTNNGELTHQLIHPRYHVVKTYKLIVQGKVKESQIEKLRKGVILTDGITLPADVQIVKQTADQTTLTVAIHEGRNRQVRRMCEAVGINLVDLQRINFGPLKLGTLPKGEYRELSKKEIQELFAAVRPQD